jgi:hypothetical protein
VHVAPLHAVRRQDRPDGIAIVVDQENRIVARDHGDELVVAPRRRKRAGEPAIVLLVDGHGEGDAVEPRLIRWGGSMMRIPCPEDDRLAIAVPGAAKVGYCALGIQKGRQSNRVSTSLSSFASLPIGGTVPIP